METIPAEARSREARRREPVSRVVAYDDQVRLATDPAVEAPPVEVRRVRRVIRRIDTWSLFRFSLMLYLCALAVGMAALIGVWVVAQASGAIPSIQNFISQLFALKNFTFRPVQMLLGALALGIIGVFVATLVTVVMGTLYNLITDVVGGIEVTVLEEEPIEVVG